MTAGTKLLPNEEQRSIGGEGEREKPQLIYRNNHPEYKIKPPP
jgi:hypothetical protein